MNSLLINCRLFKINSYNLTEWWCLCVLSPQVLDHDVPMVPRLAGGVGLAPRCPAAPVQEALAQSGTWAFPLGMGLRRDVEDRAGAGIAPVAVS